MAIKRSQTEMVRDRVDLLDDEEIVFERKHVVLTNLRLLTDWSGDTVRGVNMVRDFDGVQRIDGGQESRLEIGLKVLGVGAAVSIVQLLLDIFALPPSIDRSALLRIANTLLFVVGAAGLGTGVYLILTSWLRIKPHTSLFFIRFKGKNVRVSFPGRHSIDAQELKDAFNRQRRILPF